MSRALLEHTSDEPPRPRDRDQVPYEPHEWDRKLAEARAKREAALKQRAAEQEATESPGTSNSVRDALTAVATHTPWARSAQEPEAVAAPAAQGPARRGPLPTFIAGCMVGAVMTGLVVIGIMAADPGAELQAGASETTASTAMHPSTAATAGQAEPGAETGPLSTPATPVRSEAAKIPSDGTEAAAATAPEILPSPSPASQAHAAMAHEAPPPSPTPGATGAPAATQPAPPSRPQVETGAKHPASQTGGGTDAAVAPASNTTAATAAAAPADEAPAGLPGSTAAATADVPAPGAGWSDLAAAPPVAPAPVANRQVSPLAASASRVVVLAPRSVPRDAREEAAALLRETGWPARDPRSSPFTISETHVRYYHAEDRPAAEELAALFSAEARDFTGYARRPEAGMLELWLAGRAPARRVQPSRPALPPPLQAVADALNRLAQGGRLN